MRADAREQTSIFLDRNRTRGRLYSVRSTAEVALTYLSIPHTRTASAGPRTWSERKLSRAGPSCSEVPHWLEKCFGFPGRQSGTSAGRKRRAVDDRPVGHATCAACGA